jgi:WhiB family redox-sensing transcriptional regulator
LGGWSDGLLGAKLGVGMRAASDSGDPAGAGWSEEPQRTSWYHRAACAEADPRIFFPVGTGADALKAEAEAKSICARCPVCAECRRFALVTNQQYGIWGGLDEEERRVVRREWRRGARGRKVTSGPAHS